MTDNFNRAYSVLSVHEGFKVTNDKDDSGGLTYAGITQKWINSLGLNIDVTTLNPQKAKDIYYEYRWIPSEYDKINDARIATKIFDFDCHAGKFNAIKLLQRSLNLIDDATKLKVDGLMGSKTLSYLNALSNVNIDLLLNIMAKNQAAYYWMRCVKKPNNIKYMGGKNGWLNRARWKDFGDEFN